MPFPVDVISHHRQSSQSQRDPLPHLFLCRVPPSTNRLPCHYFRLPVLHIPPAPVSHFPAKTLQSAYRRPSHHAPSRFADIRWLPPPKAPQLPSSAHPCRISADTEWRQTVFCCSVPVCSDTWTRQRLFGLP